MIILLSVGFILILYNLIVVTFIIRQQNIRAMVGLKQLVVVKMLRHNVEFCTQLHLTVSKLKNIQSKTKTIC